MEIEIKKLIVVGVALLVVLALVLWYVVIPSATESQAKEELQKLEKNDGNLLNVKPDLGMCLKGYKMFCE